MAPVATLASPSAPPRPLHCPPLLAFAGLSRGSLKLGQAHLEAVRRATWSPLGTWLVRMWTRVFWFLESTVMSALPKLCWPVAPRVETESSPYRHPRGTSDRLAVNAMSPRLASLWALLVSMAWDPRYALVIPDKGAATSSVAALVAVLTMVLVALAITLMQALGLDVARLVMAVAGASVQTPPSALTPLTSSRSMPLQLWCRVSTIPPWDMLDAGTGTPP
jgi:hypothetical protein